VLRRPFFVRVVPGDFRTLSRYQPKVRTVPDEPEIERLRAIQERRAKHEGEEAEWASDPNDRKAHERRADKAAYLRDRLEDQAAAPDA
jgi:hypothetical protein